MQLPFFYEPTLTETDKLFALSSDSHKHAIQVLRMKANDALHLTNGKGLLSRAIIIDADKKQCTVQVQSIQFFEEASNKISIGISLLKNTTRIEWFLEKVTELGVSNVHLLQCHRTEKQHFRYDRLNGIVIAAMLQSQQTWLPILHQPTAFNEVVLQSTHPIKLIAHCEEAIKIPLQKIKPTTNTFILIGPEGDFTPEEIDTATQNNFTAVSLGNTRLRTETAGVVAATLLVNHI
jgi:16S rRNA (uracil1498-N3)-methyltransferase